MNWKNSQHYSEADDLADRLDPQPEIWRIPFTVSGTKVTLSRISKALTRATDMLAFRLNGKACGGRDPWCAMCAVIQGRRRHLRLPAGLLEPHSYRFLNLLLIGLHLDRVAFYLATF